jgi:hypothetical protein
VATLWCRARTLPDVVAWMGLKERTAVAAFVFGDGFHTSPHPAPFAQRQPFRPSPLHPVHDGRKSTQRRRIFLNEASEENPTTQT